MIISIVAFILLLLSSWVFLKRSFRGAGEERAHMGLLSILLTVGVMSGIILILGFIGGGIFSPLPALAVMIIYCVFALSKGAVCLIPHLRATLDYISSHPVLYVSLGLVGIVFLISLARIVVLPPNAFDTLTYHLPISIDWFTGGKISLLGDVPVERIRFAPKIPKLINYWIVLFSQDFRYIALSQYVGILLLFSSTWATLTLLKVRRLWVWLGSCMVIAIPIVVIQYHTLQDHVLLTALHLSLIAIVLMAVRGYVKPSRVILLLSLAGGLLLGSKFSSPAHLGSVFISVLIFYRGFLRECVSRKYIFYYSIGATLVLAFGFVWYFANHLQYGSPLGPTYPQISESFKLLRNLAEFPINITDITHRYTPDLINISGFGVHVFAIGIPITLLALLTRNLTRDELFVLCNACITTVAYFSVYYTSYNYRLIIILPVVFMIVGVSQLSRRYHDHVPRLIGASIIAGIVFTGYTTLFVDYLPRPAEALYTYLRSYPNDRSIIRYDYTADKFSRDPSWLIIDQYLPAEEPIIYFTRGKPGYDDNVIAPYYDWKMKRKVLWGGHLESTPWIDKGRPTAELVDYMRGESIRVLHLNWVFFLDPPAPLVVDGTPFIQITPYLYILNSEDTNVFVYR